MKHKNRETSKMFHGFYVGYKFHGFLWVFTAAAVFIFYYSSGSISP